MGRLENGKWIDQWHNTKETQGRYVMFVSPRPTEIG